MAFTMVGVVERTGHDAGSFSVSDQIFSAVSHLQTFGLAAFSNCLGCIMLGLAA